MEIYNLKDEIPGGKDFKNRRSRRGVKCNNEEGGFNDEGSSVFNEMVITDLKQGVKNPNRVNVFINGKFNFSLDLAQVVDYKIKVGRKVSSKEIEEFKKASEFGKLYQRALEWTLMRPRSEKEVYEYLLKKVYEKKLEKSYINEIISRLKEKKYLDDEVFSRYYVENRFVKKGISKRRLGLELRKKGISEEVISEVLNGRDDEEEILKIIKRKSKKYDDEKLISYLVRQGFPFEMVRNLVQDYGKD